MNGGWGISYEIALRLIPLNLTGDKSTLVQVMAWCRQAPISMSLNGVTRPQWVLILILSSWILVYKKHRIYLHISSFRNTYIQEVESFHSARQWPVCTAYIKCHGCWWPGDAMRQGMSIDMIVPYLSQTIPVSTRNINNMANTLTTTFS